MLKILYKVTLTQEERNELEDITKHGNHNSQNILNALILLGVDAGEFQTTKKTGVQLCEMAKLGRLNSYDKFIGKN